MKHHGVAGPRQVRSYCVIHTYSKEHHEVPRGGWTHAGKVVLYNTYLQPRESWSTMGWVATQHITLWKSLHDLFISPLPGTRNKRYSCTHDHSFIHSSKLLNSNIISPMDRKKCYPSPAGKKQSRLKTVPLRDASVLFIASCILKVLSSS